MENYFDDILAWPSDGRETEFSETVPQQESYAQAIFAGLNPQQKAAVENTEGPCLIVAGAGSGKTRVLTSRIANLLGKGVPAERILALTFTKKAAGEMKERIAEMVGKRLSRRLYMGTFHSVFIRILRDYARDLGYPENFTIYDTGDSQTAIKNCVKELGLDDKVYKPKEVLSRISLAKNALYTPADYRRNAKAMQQDNQRKKPKLCDVFELYQQKMKMAGVMDFDDILLNMHLLLRGNRAACDEISGRFGYVLVDEYQDTNMAQYWTIKTLSQGHRNLCVVGDDSQSIYGFRGARIENILNFQKDFPEVSVYRLEQNYRSTQNIVDAANSLIANNAGRIPKTCFSEGDTGDKIRLLHAFSEQDEARQIASEIVRKMQRDHAQYQDFAVLYRMNSQSRAIEEALRTRNIPYMIYSGHSFFDRAEVKDMMGYLKLCVNTSDDESFRRIIGKPARGIGETTVNMLAIAAREHSMPLMAAIGSVNLEEYGIKSAAAKRLEGFKAMILKHNAMLPTCGADTIAKGLADDSGLYAFFKSDKSVEGQSKAANVEELMNSISLFMESRRNDFREEFLLEHEGADIDESTLPVVTLGEWLEDISLLSSVDVGEDEDSANRVKLMTAHSSKGLEFPYVFVAGMEENIFPAGSSMASTSEIEEERRLFYVAMTRAESALFLSFCDTRMHNGNHESNSPSRFIHEISPQYISNPLPSGKGFGDDTLVWPGKNRASFPPTGRGSNQNSASRQGVGRFFNGARQEHSNAPIGFRPASSLGCTPSPSSHSIARSNDFSTSSPLDFRKGQRVEHSKFGLGTVKEISGSSTNLRARVEFDDYGEKVLLINYAKMRIL